MRKIGLVGGTGPESTLMYYKELNSRIDAMTEGSAMPDVAIESVNFRKAWGFVERGEYDKLTDYLSEKVECLKAGGAEIISLSAVTMHIVFGQIEAKTNTQLISIPKAVRDEAVAREFKCVGLLGTIFTMEQDYMKKDLLEGNEKIAALLPKVERLNIVITDLDTFTNSDIEHYRTFLANISEKVKALYLDGETPQFNLLTDRIMLSKPNHCNAGVENITLAPNGKFYICPAFYYSNPDDSHQVHHH